MPATPKPAYDRLAARRRLAEGYDASNREAALIIIAEAARYGGPDSLMVTWAREWLAAHDGHLMARGAA